MALPDITKKLVETKLAALCAKRIPPHARHQVKLTYRLRGNSASLIEQRVYFKDASRWIDAPVAQFRFDTTTMAWSLYCRDRHQRWHFYEPLAPTPNLDRLIAEVDSDPTCIFWG